MQKPRLFLGSSKERLPVARVLKELLADCGEVTVWDEAPEFALGESTLDGLMKVADGYDFALLVFGSDDSMMIRGSVSGAIRDNVIFELGLLIGKMGRGRALWLSPQGPAAPHSMADLEGITHLVFEEPPDLQGTAAIRTALAATREKICRQITLLGFRTDPSIHEVPMRRALCLASSQYSQLRFEKDLEYIHNFFPKSVTSERGVTADGFLDYFAPGNLWDVVHLGLFVDKENQRMLFDSAREIGKEFLGIEAIGGMLKGCRAALAVIITCDSLKFGAHLARFTNVIAGYQAIAPNDAIDWAKVFYRDLSMGVPLSLAFNNAQDSADPGLILLAHRDITFRKQATRQVEPQP